MTYSERMVIEAKFSSVCPKCNVRIQPRESIEWKRGEAGRHIECPAVAVAVTQVMADADDRAYDAWMEYPTRLHMQAEASGSYPKPVARLQVEDAGVYVLPDDSIVKMQANREKTAVYPKLFVDTSSDRLDGEAQHVRGEFRYIEDWTERRELRERVEATGRKMTRSFASTADVSAAGAQSRSPRAWSRAWATSATRTSAKVPPAPSFWAKRQPSGS
jgi:hypothetical protein